MMDLATDRAVAFSELGDNVCINKIKTQEKTIYKRLTSSYSTIIPNSSTISQLLDISDSLLINRKTCINTGRNRKKISSYRLFMHEYCLSIKLRNVQKDPSTLNRYNQAECIATARQKTRLPDLH